MQRKRVGRVLVVFREATRAELLAEWRRRREACSADIAAAKAAGDFVAYRELKQRWDRYFTKDCDAHDGGPSAAA